MEQCPLPLPHSTGTSRQHRSASGFYGCVPRLVGHSTALQLSDNPLGQAASHGHCIDTRLEGTDPLPLGDPAVLRAHHGDDPVEGGAGAVISSQSFPCGSVTWKIRRKGSAIARGVVISKWSSLGCSEEAKGWLLEQFGCCSVSRSSMWVEPSWHGKAQPTLLCFYLKAFPVNTGRLQERMEGSHLSRGLLQT